MSEPSSPPSESLDELIKQNIVTIREIEEEFHGRRSRAETIADSIAGFCGSMTFVYVHGIWFAAWLAWNCVLTTKPFHWDPPPFNMLTLVVSLEAIFLSTFILVSQNRQQKIADHRNHLDLQINLLAEQENSQMLAMLRAITEHLKLDAPDKAVLEEEVDPKQLAEAIETVMDAAEAVEEQPEP